MRSSYLPQLDSLRAFSVLLVITYHWFPSGEGINHYPTGPFAVVIFFQLSGFLITRILLDNRVMIQQGYRTLKDAYRNFIIRRSLRIFPLYYLVITLVFFFLPATSDVSKHPLYYYFYGYNILLNKTGNWADTLSPFWTLAVEEQLYLLWPWFALLTSKYSFRWVIVGMFVTAIAFRGYSFTQGDLDGVLTLSCLDTFGAGALWAYIVTDYPKAIPSFLKKLPIVAGVALVLFIGLLFLPTDHLLVVLFQRTLLSIFALFMMVKASMGVKGVIGKILDSPALQYIGRISYGIYVFHMLVPGFAVALFVEIIHRLHLPITLGFWSHRLISLIVLIALASLSWYAFEKPFNNLKRYFPQKQLVTG